MTPEEAIKAIYAECDETTLLLHTRSEFDSALAEAIKALEEIQKYREIGTVEQIKNQKHNMAVAYKIISDYESCGTVEECREAMEKYRPKKCADENLEGTECEMI